MTNTKNRGELNARWNGGNSEYKNHYLMKWARKFKLEAANNVCELCGGLATEIHHKDKSKDNHNINNLMALCHKCHMKNFHSFIDHQSDENNNIDAIKGGASVSELLKDYRINNGLSLRDCAELFGISHATIRTIESGGTVTAKTAKKIAPKLQRQWSTLCN